MAMTVTEKVVLTEDELLLCTWMRERGVPRDDAIKLIPQLLNFANQFNGQLGDPGFQAAIQLILRRANAMRPKPQPNPARPKKAAAPAA